MSKSDRLRLMQLGEKNMNDFFVQLIHTLQGTVLRYSTSANVVPRPKWDRLRQEVRSVVTQAFLGPTHTYQLYTVDRGVLHSSSPYLNALWPAFSQSARLGALEQQHLVAQKLKDHPDITEALSHTAVKRPRVVREIEVRPTVEYDPLHHFVGPDGYTLSDRVWNTAIDTRAKLDLFMADELSLGRSARDISKDLESFLTPGEALRTTNKPYGTTASFSGMRLARTEIASAHTLASHAAAQKNPFVMAYNVVLSGSHPKEDECDEAADGGPYDKTDTSMLPPLHPHCLCHVEWVSAEDTESVIAQLQALLSGDGGKVDNIEVDPEEDLASAIADLFTGKILDWLLGG